MTTRTMIGATESGMMGRVQWGAILAGALAGFAATIILATLGAAIGISAGACAVDSSPNAAENTAIGIGVGAALWMLITAVLVGFVGGAVLNRTARHDRPYLPVAFGTLTWAVGVFLALIVASSGMTGAAGALGGGAAGAGVGSQGVAGRPSMNSNGRIESSSMPKLRADLTDQESAKLRMAADKAAKAAVVFAWVVLGTQLVSLAATLLAARWQKAREFPAKLSAQPA